MGNSPVSSDQRINLPAQSTGVLYPKATDQGFTVKTMFWIEKEPVAFVLIVVALLQATTG